MTRPLTDSELLQLQRWNTPTIYNGWEQITRHDSAHDAVNLEETRDYMPEALPICGWAVTVVIQPGDRSHAPRGGEQWAAYREHLASVPGPKLVVVQDLDKPACHGAGWGEVNANIHRALGCIGAIIDGAVRDVDEMRHTGLKTLARRMAVGHGYAIPIRWGCEVEVFGRKVQPGQLIHADKHGFIAIPPGEEREHHHAAASPHLAQSPLHPRHGSGACQAGERPRGGGDGLHARFSAPTDRSGIRCRPRPDRETRSRCLLPGAAQQQRAALPRMIHPN